MRLQRWRTFVRHHAGEILAHDFCVVVMATFRLLHVFYVFVVIEHATHGTLHARVTAPLTAHWTLQHLRETIPADHGYRFLLSARDSKFSPEPDQSIRHLGLSVLKTPVRTPPTNALCEWLLGTLRCECLDFSLPLTENHLRYVLHPWVQHGHGDHPHMG